MTGPSRRSVTLGLAALGWGGMTGPALARMQGMEVPAAPRPDPAYHAWVSGFRARAQADGISPAVFDRAFAGARYLPKIVATDVAQSQARRTLMAQIGRMASEARIAGGKRALKAHRALFDRIADRYGVPAEVVAAIWGVETGYGVQRGSTPVISALSTLASEARRSAFFEAQLIGALRILEAGDIAPGEMLGSWAGAMGHTQFMPGTYLAHAVDFEGDGRRDIWADDPTDALASAANYLAQSGWETGKLWGLEVVLPGASDDLVSRPVADWSERGVTRVGGGALPDHGDAELILPDGAGGAAFLLFANYRVLRAYNDSMKYALGVGHLADRIGGGRALSKRAQDGAVLDFEDRQAVQTRLTEAGFDTGGADGVIGDKTTAAIRAYQVARGLAETGLADRALLTHLGG